MVRQSGSAAKSGARVMADADGEPTGWRRAYCLGAYLIEQRANLGHGAFGKWAKEHRYRSARVYMQVFRAVEREPWLMELPDISLREFLSQVRCRRGRVRQFGGPVAIPLPAKLKR